MNYTYTFMKHCKKNHCSLYISFYIHIMFGMYENQVYFTDQKQFYSRLHVSLYFIVIMLYIDDLL